MVYTLTVNMEQTLEKIQSFFEDGYEDVSVRKSELGYHIRGWKEERREHHRRLPKGAIGQHFHLS